MLLRAAVLLASLAGCSIQYNTHDDNSGSGPFHPDAGADATIAPPAPILHYRFDDSLANEGSLGRAYDGTGQSFTFVEGVAGKAVAFDTTWTTQVLLPTQEVMSKPSDYTIALWFREDAVSDSFGYLFDNRGAGGFQTYHGASANQALTTCSDAGCQAFGYSVGTWHHLLYRHLSGGALEIYIDGMLATSLPASDVYFSSTQTSIALGTRTNFQIDELEIYNRVLPVGSQP